MAETDHSLITRWSVIVDAHGRGPQIDNAFRFREQATAKAADCVRYQAMFSIGSPPAEVWISRWELRPNTEVIAFGVERFDAMLTNVGQRHIELTGSLADLIACGAIGGYVRDVIGKSGSKKSCDEYGNGYSLHRRGKDQYELDLWLCDEAEIPHACSIKKLTSLRDPSDVDLTEILSRFKRTAAC